MKKKFIFLCLVFIVSISTWNLFHAGYPLTHDGDVHLLRLTDFYQSLQDGVFIPRWAAHVNWGYGQPVFEFFYPLPSYLASLLHFAGFSFANSLKILLMISLLLSGATMYLWLSQILSRQAAFVASVLYVFAPFRLVDVYVRGDVGESLGFVFVPLILFYIAMLARTKKVKYIFLGGTSIALLILCHNVISLMFLPFIFWYGLYQWIFTVKRSRIYVVSFLGMIVVGFLLSAFFWIPGLLEARFTLKDIVTAGEYKDRFVSIAQLLYSPWSYGGTGEFTVQVGILQWVGLLSSLLILPFIAKKEKKQAAFLCSLVIFASIAIFLMLPVSNPVWSKILLLQNFQFPWRFLAVTIFACSVIAGLIIDVHKRLQSWLIVGVIVVVSLFLNYPTMHALRFLSRPDSYFSGVIKAPADTGESSPIWSVRFMEAVYKSPLEVISGEAKVTNGKRTTVIHMYALTAVTKTRLVENTLYFPGWKVFVDNREVPVQFQDEQYRGLMTFWVSPGKHTILVAFGDTKLRRVADIISLATFVTMLIASLFFWRKST